MSYFCGVGPRPIILSGRYQCSPTLQLGIKVIELPLAPIFNVLNDMIQHVHQTIISRTVDDAQARFQGKVPASPKYAGVTAFQVIDQPTELFLCLLFRFTSILPYETISVGVSVYFIDLPSGVCS